MRDDRPIWHNEFQYDKWDAFVNGRTGEQQMAWERQQQRISVMRMEARMRDTNTDLNADAIVRDLDDLIAENARLRAALREMTDKAQAMGDVLEADFGKYPTNTREILERHGVAELMDTTTAT